jgi:DNA replication protein DnaC
MYNKKYKVYYGGSSSIDSKIEQQLEKATINAESLSYSRIEFDSFPRDDLRLKIIMDYNKPKKPYIDFSKLTDIGTIVQACNLQYSGRESLSNSRGIYYADDFVKMHGDTYNWIKLQGLANLKYWDTSATDSLFRIRDGILPSDALSSFFSGPTFADCGNVIQASVYQYIQNIIGIDTFNEVFNNPISQFLITKYQFDELETNENNVGGNPLFFLFDIIDIPLTGSLEILPPIIDTKTLPLTGSSKTLQNGDIIYIRGVEDYFKKHLAGFAPGWNLVVVKEPGKETKFIGFGPDSFSKGPITYEELKQVLINYYNEDHSKETLEKIRLLKKTDAHLKGSTSVGLVEDDDYLNQIKIQLAELLAKDKKPLDSDIVGLQYGIRFNLDKLHMFIKKTKTWFRDMANNPIKTEIVSAIGEKITKSNISSENLKSDFSNYNTDTKERKELFDLMVKFGNAVNEKKSADPSIGLIISGKPGIGKTHLSISVFKYVIKNVLYIDEKYISETFQKTATYPNFKLWLQGIDLIILDDLNSIFGIGSMFLKESIKYCILNKKSILVSSNTHLDVLYSSVPYYIGYDNPIRLNYLIVNDLVSTSYRIPWSEPLIDLDNENKLRKLLDYTGDQSAGVVLFFETLSPEIILTIEKDILALKADSKIRIARDPYRNQRVYDLYMHDIDEFDTFIIKVENRNEGEQLINLIQNAHDMAAKIIVISKNGEVFKQNVNYNLDSYGQENYKVRRIDRLRIIFPGYW